MSRPSVTHRDGASYRDPSGFVFRRDGVLYRQINRSFATDWAAFRDSGLATNLASAGLLIGHRDVDPELAAAPDAIAVIEPEPVGLVTYPYEWAFSQLKDAALLTLELQERGTAAGLALKDASAYNIQFHGGRPILIDSLSFERAEAGAPWVAYRQFCEHFLAPLALMANRDVRCGLLLREFVDGLPLDLTVALLPGRSRFRLGIFSHLHLHARAQRRHRSTAPDGAGAARKISPMGQRALLDSLRRTVEQLRWRAAGTEWADYSDNTSYSQKATQAKRELVARLLRGTGDGWIWDLGANTGAYSRLAAEGGRPVAALDVDPAAVDIHYRRLRADNVSNVLPLLQDLTNPSPALGWALAERRSIVARADADAVLALALIHHLAISKNVPLGHLSVFFAEIGRHLIIEFVPKEDPMVRRLLATRRDVFPGYTLDGFRDAFAERWAIVEEAPIPGTARILFKMTRRRT